MKHLSKIIMTSGLLITFLSGNQEALTSSNISVEINGQLYILINHL
ncbi:hypothetical protein [Heyndrickxia ginsengihumi]|nr:hypothetical protein [Heyndrickxia ginsengihumi]MCM3024655.1 hypothetical protein [Heyndrickxia ginsengihumi]